MIAKRGKSERLIGRAERGRAEGEGSTSGAREGARNEEREPEASVARKFVQAACALAPATVSTACCPNAFTVRVSPTMNTAPCAASDSAPLRRDLYVLRRLGVLNEGIC